MSLLFVLFLFFRITVCEEVGLGPFKILKEWPKVTYDTKCLKRLGQVYYRSSKNEISGIRIFRNRIYLSIPRQEGVPVTLGRVSLYAGYKDTPIEPFPSWEYQNEKNCSNLISVAGFEIDASSKMWVVDNGKIGRCPPKLIIFDLESMDYVQMGESKGPNCKVSSRTVKLFEFPEDVVPRKEGFQLGEIVVDSTGPKMFETTRAYIAYSDTENPGVLVYDFKTDRCYTFPLQEKGNSDTNVKNAGLALSPPSQNRTLYYTPRGSLRFYSAQVELLKKDNATEEEKTNAFEEIGNKTSISDGMMADSKGNLYFGLESEHSVVKWNPGAGDFETQKTILASDSNLTWIDSFAFDLMGNLYFTVNRTPGSQGIVSRIYSGRVGYVRSYLYKDVIPFK